MTTRYHSSAPGLGDVLGGRRAGRVLPRTGNPVRRGSVDVNDERARRFVLPIDDDETAAFLQAAERYNLEHKQDGKYVGPFRSRGMDVLRWLLREARSTKGWCCPSAAQIAAALKIGLRTIRRIVKALYVAGFLDRLRRSIEVDAEEGGARREQTSSLYQFNLPAGLAGLVSRLVAKRTGRPVRPIRGMRIVGRAELEARALLWQQSLDGSRLAGVLQRLAMAVDASTEGAKLALS